MLPTDSGFFANTLITWYSRHKRSLPWRDTTNPYYIWLSEVILQQTRVAQGLPYYQKFVAAYPTVQDLAAAPENEVLRLWQGLGYYSRARNMHHTAKQIVQEFGGNFQCASISIRVVHHDKIRPEKPRLPSGNHGFPFI